MKIVGTVDVSDVICLWNVQTNFTVQTSAYFLRHWQGIPVCLRSSDD